MEQIISALVQNTGYGWYWCTVKLCSSFFKTQCDHVLKGLITRTCWQSYRLKHIYCLEILQVFTGRLPQPWKTLIRWISGPWVGWLVVILYYYLYHNEGTWWRSWLKHCASSREVTGSIPYGVIGIFHWLEPSGRTMALGSTQLLRAMRTRSISWGLKTACE